MDLIESKISDKLNAKKNRFAFLIEIINTLQTQIGQLEKKIVFFSSYYVENETTICFQFQLFLIEIVEFKKAK